MNPRDPLIIIIFFVFVFHHRKKPAFVSSCCSHTLRLVSYSFSCLFVFFSYCHSQFFTFHFLSLVYFVSLFSNSFLAPVITTAIFTIVPILMINIGRYYGILYLCVCVLDCGLPHIPYMCVQNVTKIYSNRLWLIVLSVSEETKFTIENATTITNERFNALGHAHGSAFIDFVYWPWTCAFGLGHQLKPNSQFFCCCRFQSATAAASTTIFFLVLWCFRCFFFIFFLLLLFPVIILTSAFLVDNFFCHLVFLCSMFRCPLG